MWCICFAFPLGDWMVNSGIGVSGSIWSFGQKTNRSAVRPWPSVSPICLWWTDEGDFTQLVFAILLCSSFVLILWWISRCRILFFFTTDEPCLWGNWIAKVSILEKAYGWSHGEVFAWWHKTCWENDSKSYWDGGYLTSLLN
jgi:hypothetical protein